MVGITWKKNGGKSVSRGQTIQTLLDDAKEFEFILKPMGSHCRVSSREISEPSVSSEKRVLAIWRMENGLTYDRQTNENKAKTWELRLLRRRSLDLGTESKRSKGVKEVFGDGTDRIFCSEQVAKPSHWIPNLIHFNIHYRYILI